MFPPTRNSFSRVSKLSFVLDLAKEHASLSNHLDKQSDPFVTKAHMFPMFVFQILVFFAKHLFLYIKSLIRPSLYKGSHHE